MHFSLANTGCVRLTKKEWPLTQWPFCSELTSNNEPLLLNEAELSCS